MKVKGDPEFFILTPMAWLDASKLEDRILGAVVDRYPAPSQLYAPSDKSPKDLGYIKDDPSEINFDNFVLSSEEATTAQAAATLKSLAKFNWSGETDSAVNLSGKLITCRTLQQVDKYWKELTAHEEMKERVPGWVRFMKDPPVCLVIGIMICHDVEVDWTGARSRNMQASGEVPLHVITAAATGVPSPAGSTGNPQVQALQAKQNYNVFRAGSGGSKIFALSLRVISKKWFSRQLKLDEGPAIKGGRAHGLDSDDEMGSDDEDLVLTEDTPGSLE